MKATPFTIRKVGQIICLQICSAVWAVALCLTSAAVICLASVAQAVAAGARDLRCPQAVTSPALAVKRGDTE